MLSRRYTLSLSLSHPSLSLAFSVHILYRDCFHRCMCDAPVCAMHVRTCHVQIAWLSINVPLLHKSETFRAASGTRARERALKKMTTLRWSLRFLNPAGFSYVRIVFFNIPFSFYRAAFFLCAMRVSPVILAVAFECEYLIPSIYTGRCFKGTNGEFNRSHEKI